MATASGSEGRKGLFATKDTDTLVRDTEEKEADAILVGASTKGKVARKVLGSVPVELIQRARRPVIVISPPS